MKRLFPFLLLCLLLSSSFVFAFHEQSNSDHFTFSYTKIFRLISYLFVGPGSPVVPPPPPEPPSDADGDGYTSDSGDCDDTNANIYPDAGESCFDSIDNDCDSLVDLADPECGGSGSSAVDTDNDGALDTSDCAPSDPAIYPGAVEICDGKDNNCDGTIDQVDADLDGYKCPVDCDDQDASTKPSAPDMCSDTKDNNCDGTINEGCSTGTTTCVDNDGDGYTGCTECNDNNIAVHPGSSEICSNLIDDDCDGTMDESSCTSSGFPLSDTTSQSSLPPLPPPSSPSLPLVDDASSTLDGLFAPTSSSPSYLTAEEEAYITVALTQAITHLQRAQSMASQSSSTQLKYEVALILTQLITELEDILQDVEADTPLEYSSFLADVEDIRNLLNSLR